MSINNEPQPQNQSPYEALRKVVEQKCAQKLDEIETFFSQYSAELGKQARELAVYFTISFGVRPGQPVPTRTQLAEYTTAHHLQFDETKKMFFISDANTTFHLNGDDLSNPLTQKIIELAEETHTLFGGPKAQIDRPRLQQAIFSMTKHTSGELYEKQVKSGSTLYKAILEKILTKYPSINRFQPPFELVLSEILQLPTLTDSEVAQLFGFTVRLGLDITKFDNQNPEMLQKISSLTQLSTTEIQAKLKHYVTVSQPKITYFQNPY